MIGWLAALDPLVLLIGFTALGVLAALPLEIAAVRRIYDLRVASGTLYLLLGAFVLLLGVSAALLATSLRTYARLTHEQDAARVSMRQLGNRHYVVSVQAKNAAPRHFELRGDEWQIDARVLKWRGIATVAGFDTVYRLERLSGRYAAIGEERSARRTVHDLSESTPVDFWALARRYQDYVPLADARYGSAAYVPMAEGAEYAVKVSASGLVVRPGNEAARKAVGGWK
jgi:hypothetical protein